MKKTASVPILFFLFLFHIHPCFSADVKDVRQISFGSIIACQSGDVVEINARNGPVDASGIVIKGCSVIDGGHSGAFCVTSDTEGQTINVIYPGSVTLKALGYAKTVTMNSMNTLSTTRAVSTAADEDIDFYVGGRLHIESGYPQSAFYSGEMTITIDIINP